jgi:hypothetical protein
MKIRSASKLFFLMFLAAVPGALQADTVSISQIYVSIGPNANTPSPSYGGYTANAQTGVASGGVNVGGNIVTTPTAYNVIGSGGTATVGTGSIIGTPFPSWLSVADPTGALASETGNMLYWSIVVSGMTGVNDISLSQLSVTQSSTDPLDSFGDPTQPSGVFSFSFSGVDYAADTVGILANGTQITSGSSAQLVNQLVITGFSADLDPALLSSITGVTFSGTDAQQMQEMDNAFESTLGNFSINTCFAYSGVAPSCDTVNVITPEPASVSLLLLALWLMPFIFYPNLYRIFGKWFRIK